jgi:hypothetical protein
LLLFVLIQRCGVTLFFSAPGSNNVDAAPAPVPTLPKSEPKFLLRKKF